MRRRSRQAVVSGGALSLLLFVLFFLLLCSTSARAYRRSISEHGAELWWEERTLVFVLDDNGCADIDDGSDFEALRASFDEWNKVICDYGPFRMDLVDGGLVSGREVGYDEDGPNENLLVFQQEPGQWQHSSSAIAMTLVTHDIDNGKIYDVDVEFNDLDFRFATHIPPPPLRRGDTTQDLRNTATHEIGHMLGLDHSLETRATMWSEARPWETSKRDLHEDDILGICTVVPPDGRKSGKKTGGGCSLGSASGPAELIPRAVLLLAAWLGLMGAMGLRGRR